MTQTQVNHVKKNVLQILTTRPNKEAQMTVDLDVSRGDQSGRQAGYLISSASQ